MPIEYANGELLHADDFAALDAWHHEGIGEIAHAPDGGMRLHCHGSRQGGQGCMAFFRENLPDQVAVEDEMTIHTDTRLVVDIVTWDADTASLRAHNSTAGAITAPFATSPLRGCAAFGSTEVTGE